ncbi:Asp23/Gls24 family envelope stress response protein [Amycolatopsis suaedae]|uniref:Asp23/Gls24 family envelope stress response protein n=1 Tax=Amycolatopsis suaedae TaxID=2510978 RepID=A0A4Q7J9Z0_9PSEU|nr:Asp23/Gls24 family envelope stress response protein [Amycolatopsis suaedae]RZQ64610.1 Asp23/Gls24 family envelope stress response protein [Amycolatopsis suaedae]
MTTTLLEPAADRGVTTVGDRVVEHIAARAVTEVDGVGGAAGRVLGLGPRGDAADRAAKVTAKVGGGMVSLTVRLSVGYPASVARTTEDARGHLRRRVAELTGLTVSHVDIVVTELHNESGPRRRVL